MEEIYIKVLKERVKKKQITLTQLPEEVKVKVESLITIEDGNKENNTSNT